MIVFAFGLYFAQWNRYGGPFGIKMGLAYAGLGLLLTTQAARFLLASGIGKTFFFGFSTALIACYNGLRTSGGADGVGADHAHLLGLVHDALRRAQAGQLDLESLLLGPFGGDLGGHAVEMLLVRHQDR